MFLRLMKLTPPATTEKSTLAGCELVKRGRPVNGRSGGGVCMYLRSNINYRIHNDLCEDFECIIVELTNPHSPVNGRSGGVCVCIFVVTSIIVYITTYVKTLNALLLN